MLWMSRQRSIQRKAKGLSEMHFKCSRRDLKSRSSEMKHSLAATGLLLTVLAVGLTAQRADQYRQKYGAPDSHSRYIVRPDIGMTVEFAENGQASNIVIRRGKLQQSGRFVSSC